ncbi:serine protease [Oenococcus oeni]|uniref:S1C family serine protease n=1 Tax=Oenococcus oeni TaxID=1247 RepID=UPI0008F83B81|nr:trypsin-like peptidase domain-containing protein [Oenococcus oeni]OIL14236.1 serine protease [Oenococcus oeni]OIM73155.1 serine protease [Oenococcus oeni]OLQ43893.1 serine protease [Oenococcus oeni]
MTEEQDQGKTQKDIQGKKPKKNRPIGRIIATALLAGFLGGGVAVGAGYIYTQTTDFIGKSTGSLSDGKTTIKAPTISGKSNATKVYNNLKGAVVSVINQQATSSSSTIYGDSSKKSSSSTSSSSTLQTASEGSGVIYKDADGYAYIVTNYHVISGAKRIQVVLYDGTKVVAKKVGSDAMTDLAVLRISGSDVKTVAQFGNSNQIKTGQTVLAIGSPLGTDYASSVTEGIISASKRLVSNTSESGKTNYGDSIAIQTDAAINPGNSGGPLVNTSGQVIGINSQKLTETDEGESVEGMGFAIPSNTVVSIINKLIKYGKVVRPALGVEVVDLSEVSSDVVKKTLKLPSKVKTGIVIAGFSSDKSPAKKAGIKKYDVIVAVNGEKVSNLADMRDIIYKLKVGDTVKITYYRASTEKTVKVKMTETLKQ